MITSVVGTHILPAVQYLNNYSISDNSVACVTWQHRLTLNLLINSLVEEPEDATLLISKPTTGHDTEPVPPTLQHIPPRSIFLINYLSGSKVRRFNTVNIKTQHWTWSWASFIRCPSSQLITLRFNPLISEPFVTRIRRFKTAYTKSYHWTQGWASSTHLPVYIVCQSICPSAYFKLRTIGQLLMKFDMKVMPLQASTSYILVSCNL
jgi:hypothetical protein